MLYERFHTRSIANLGGVATVAPWLAVFFLLFTFSSIGLPGLNGFVGEFLILAGSFQRAWTGVSPDLQARYLVLALAGVAGVVLGAWYMLWAVERVFFGALREPPRASHGTSESHAATASGAGHGHVHGHGHGQDAPATRCDLRWHEVAALAPLAVFVIWIGVAPATFLAPVAPAVRESTAASAAAFAERMAASTGATPGLVVHPTRGTQPPPR